MADDVSDENTVVAVVPGDPELPDSVSFEVRPEVADDLMSFLSEEGVEYQEGLERSITAMVVLTVIGLLRVNALGQLAELLDKWVHRNDGKAVVLDAEGRLREINGMSVGEIKSLLNETRELKTARDEAYAKRVAEIEAEFEQLEITEPDQ